tara:strand:- start:106 stop:417 length:312 start_codon:yes stop_codon:yes gene_type:complete
MKILLIPLLALVVLGGCSEYNQCVEIESKEFFISDDVAEMRAKNICYREPVNFQNQEEAIQAYVEEEACIESNMLKILDSNKVASRNAHDICTMRIFDEDFGS